jgi:muconolactone delta-isomerase
MEFLVTMTTRVPNGTSDEAVDDMRAREATRSHQLAAAGHLLRLWRPPLQPGEWRSVGLFSATDGDALEAVLASMPLRVWRTDEVTPLSSHPNDPWPTGSGRPAEASTEFFTTFTVAIPPGTPRRVVDDTYAREAQRAHALAEQGHLLRLWMLPDDRRLGLWRARDRQQMDDVFASLPVAAWMTVDTIPLTRHPSDPGVLHVVAAQEETSGDNGRKVVIVTGGSQGIGAGIVAAYRQLGWAVVAVARTMASSDDPYVLTIEGDISLPATAARLVEEARAHFGHIDTLINNAGLYISKSFTDYTAEDYATVVGVNLTGFFSLTQLVIGEMLGRRRGHVVNITASVAEYPESATPSVLAALTKGGVAAATRSLAIEYASRGIRVNAVSPGTVQTPIHPPESYDSLAASIPLGRVAQISDVVGAIMFLESSPFVTGEVIHVDGGRSAGR